MIDESPSNPYIPLPALEPPPEVIRISLPVAEEDYKEPYVPRIKTPEHYQILAMYLGGMYQREIAIAVGKTEQHVHNVVTCPEGQQFIKEQRERFIERSLTYTTDKIQAAASEAADAVIGLMRTSKNERVKLASAFDILDRAGFKAKEQQREAPINIDRDDAAKILEALHERNQPREELEMIQDSSGVFQNAGKKDFDHFARNKGLPGPSVAQPITREARPPSGAGSDLVDRIIHGEDEK